MERGVRRMKVDQRHRQLENVIFKTELDANYSNLPYPHEKLVKHYLRQAAQHHSAALMEPEKAAEHIKAGFDDIGQARGILGKSSSKAKGDHRFSFFDLAKRTFEDTNGRLFPVEWTGELRLHHRLISR